MCAEEGGVNDAIPVPTPTPHPNELPERHEPFDAD